MPYKQNSNLPASVKTALPEEAQTLFRGVLNQALTDNPEDEAGAFKRAWGAVSEKWKPQGKGQWIEKSSPCGRVFKFNIEKVAEDKQMVFGWLLVSADKDGNELIDYHGDIVPEDELETAAYLYVLDTRAADEMHKKIQVGHLIESVVFTREKQKAMGIPEGILPVGWWVGYLISDPATWGKIKSGEYKDFSMGGRAYRVPV